MTTPNHVINLVARISRVEPRDLVAPGNNALAILPRQIASHLLVCKLGLSATQAGEQLGFRHYTTISAQVKTIARKRLADPVFDQNISGLENLIDRIGQRGRYTVPEILDLAANAARNRRGAMALNVEQLLAITSLLTDVSEYVDAAQRLSDLITSAARPETIIEQAHQVKACQALIEEPAETYETENEHA